RGPTLLYTSLWTWLYTLWTSNDAAVTLCNSLVRDRAAERVPAGVGGSEVAFDPQHTDGRGEGVVLRDQQAEFDESAIVVELRERRPRLVGQILRRHEFVDGGEKRTMPRLPAGSVGSGDDTLAHLVGDPGTAAQAGVVVEFVTALTQMRDAQDDHLR